MSALNFHLTALALDCTALDLTALYLHLTALAPTALALDSTCT